ncbi:hypothetical protein EDB80DRAFT_865563 [Ilyonectria destructans]|nr:hypothetical protein EDB80DRAFT_865563 [Ilyonectria destructans]
MVNPSEFKVCHDKPRIFITSDIANEPDDAESLVRYLLYTNEFDTRGLVACTSTHMKRRVCPEDMIEIVNAYGQVVHNLNAHTHPANQFPDAQSLLDMITTGPALYGKEALKPNVPLSNGAKLLVDRLEESPEPLWVLCWGGSNVLAQALQHIQQTRSASDAAILQSRVRVYAISDQDDTGLWIRTTFPHIFYICSLHGWSQYHLAAWTGISGDQDGGSDLSKVSRDWIKENIQIGPLGKTYPDHKFLVEGDTPTFLYLIQNGLGSPEHPEWGSWGGRYLPVDLSLAARHYADAVDRVVGKDGKTYTSNYATIWRWRDAFQNDFAARMQWTLTNNTAKTNHAPVVIVNNEATGAKPMILEVEGGDEVCLDASGTYDPDGDELSFEWHQYKEVTTGSESLDDQQVANLELESLDDQRPGRRIRVQIPPPEKCAIDFISGQAVAKGQAFHLLLEVKDNGAPSLVTYKRVILQVVNKALRGGRVHEVYTTAEWLETEGHI